jgi:hypothetical protein
MSYKLGEIIGDNSSLLRVPRLNLADSELAHGAGCSLQYKELDRLDAFRVEVFYVCLKSRSRS